MADLQVRRSNGLAVSVTDGRGRPVRDDGLAAWLMAAAPARARGAVTIALVGDAAMRRLNRTYRGKDYATDVLSFQSEGDLGPSKTTSGVDSLESASPRTGIDPRGRFRSRSAQNVKRHPMSFSLGDIAIATGVARRQARAAGHTERVERRVLALHGLLHLLGYDHETDTGTMRLVEERLRRKAGLPAGVIARARRPRTRR